MRVGQGATQSWFPENRWLSHVLSRLHPNKHTGRNSEPLWKQNATEHLQQLSASIATGLQRSVLQMMRSKRPQHCHLQNSDAMHVRIWHGFSARLCQTNGPLRTWSFMTFCLHANQKTVSCGTWENSSSWKPCIPQRFPKICCTHGPHIGSKSFLPELSGLLGFCRVPQLINSLIKCVHEHRLNTSIYTHWYIDRDTSCYRHISHQCNMARPASQSSNLHRNSWLFHKVVSYVRTARRWKERVNKECK